MMLDPNTVQILFADLQSQIVARSKTNTPDALARSAAVLAQVAGLLHLPMHHSVVPEGGLRHPGASAGDGWRGAISARVGEPISG
jgi:hypothetical protein